VSVLGQEFVDDAEDVAQDAMLRVHQGLRSFRGDAKVGTWIYRIALNVALTAKSRTRFRAPHVNENTIGAFASTDAPMDIQLGERVRQQALLACVSELPDVYQSALRLHYWLGTSVSDIALMLNVPENTVKSYLFRARQLLRAMLTERGLDAH
jgi:RNA polymerase sigma-70 factor (ECF subfamily)